MAKKIEEGIEVIEEEVEDVELTPEEIAELNGDLAGDMRDKGDE